MIGKIFLLPTIENGVLVGGGTSLNVKILRDIRWE